MTARLFTIFPLLVTLTLLPSPALVSAFSPTSAATLGQSVPPANTPRDALAVQTDAVAEARALEAYGQLPLSFIPNQGQVDERVGYYVQSGGQSLRFTASGVTMTLPETTLRLEFLDANPSARLEGGEKLPGVVNYFIGNDPAKWRTNIPTYGRITYRDLWPGVNLTYEGRAGVLKSTFTIAPEADPAQIRLAYPDADNLVIDGQGNLIISAAGEKVRESAPQAWQEIRGQRVPVAVTYQVVVQSYSFALPEGYDPAYPLVIDPELVYSTFLGGYGDDESYAIAVDGAGSAYVTGEAYSPDFPTTAGAFDTSRNGTSDAFVVKLNITGTELSYATFLGGSSWEEGLAIAVDEAGNAYVTGTTHSSDFPTTAGAFDTSHSGGVQDAFVVKMNAAGTGLTYATFLGGYYEDLGMAIVVDGGGSAYVTGRTDSIDFPTTSGAFDTSYNGGGDPFVVKMNAAGTGLAYATFLGGGNGDGGEGIIVDGAGSAYVTGWTWSSDFPTTPGAFDTSDNYSCDAFVVKLNAAGTELAYATFLGGSYSEGGNAIAVDGAGSAYVTGETQSSDFPTTAGAFDTSYNGYWDVFVAKVNAAGTELAYATFLGESNHEKGSAIAVDGAGSAYVTGWTASPDFPTTAGAFDTNLDGGQDAFVVKLNAAGTGLAYATFLGGSSWDVGNAIAVDGAGSAYITGKTKSSDFPTTPGAFDITCGGCPSFYGDAFVVKFDLGGGPTYSISGRITDGSSNPIFGVTVSAGAGGSATTGANGDYTITGLITGTYTLTPSKSGWTFTPATRTVSVPPDATGQDFTGYDRPPIVFVHGWAGWPPWGSCDWPDPDADFQSVDDYLRNAGYHVEYARLETSPCYTPSLEKNVPRLNNAIALAKAATNQPKVILIAHSMGGLVSRAYIEGPDYDDDVAALFTFGSPHQGVPIDVLSFWAGGVRGLIGLGVYCALYQPALCEFSTLGMILFNQDHSKRAAGVTYHVISGNAPFSPRSAFGKAMYLLIPEGDDAMVPTDSGTGLSGILDRLETDEVHSTGTGPRSYFIRDGGPSTSYMQCLKPVLVDEEQNICGSVSPQQVTAKVTSTLTARTPFEYGTLLAGQTATRTIPLEGGPTLFAAQWQTGTLAATLVDPNGQAIDPAYAASHPDVVTYDADETATTYYFTNTIAGAWQLALRAISVPTGGSAYTTFAAFDSDLALTAKTDRYWYMPGTTATITASLSGSPTSATVTATILRTDGVTDTVTLSPQGTGQYQAMYTVPDAPGYAEVRLVATGTTTGSTLSERGMNLAFQISPNSVALSGDYSDTPEPRSPGSSFYDALIVTVGINAAVSGTVGLSADLVDADGNFVAHSLTIEDVTAGAGTLALRFDGDDIYTSQRNGPYTLTNLLLTDRRETTLVVAEAENVYITEAYDYHSFGSGKVYLPLVLKNH